ncbi:5198_t:CDS:1, partial [Racocetra fulgida]
MAYQQRKKEEEEFERKLKSAKDILINKFTGPTIEKMHSNNTALKSINDGNYNEQDN